MGPGQRTTGSRRSGSLRSVGFAGKLVGELSKGYRQRAGACAGHPARPGYPVAGRATSGLDPNQSLEIRHLIKESGKEEGHPLDHIPPRSGHLYPHPEHSVGIWSPTTRPEALRRGEGSRYRSWSSPMAWPSKRFAPSWPSGGVARAKKSPPRRERTPSRSTPGPAAIFAGTSSGGVDNHWAVAGAGPRIRQPGRRLPQSDHPR